MARTLTLDPNRFFASDTQHNAAVSSWADDAGGSALAVAGGSFRADAARVVMTRASRSGASPLGRASFSARVHVAAPLGARAAVLLGCRASDDAYEEIRVDRLGFPRYAVKAALGAEQVAACPASIAPRWSASVGAGTEVFHTDSYSVSYDDDLPDGATPAPPPNVPRRRYRVTTTVPHSLMTGDEVVLAGFGYIDGSHRVCNLVDGNTSQFEVVVDSPVGAADAVQANPTTVGARRSLGSSSSNLSWSLSRSLAVPVVGSGTLAMRLRKTATAQDAVSGGAGVLWGAEAGDSWARPGRVQVAHSGGGSPGTYRLAVAGIETPVVAGEATLDTWRDVAWSWSDGVVTPTYDGIEGTPIDLRGTSDAVALRPTRADYLMAAEFTLAAGSLGQAQDIVGFWGSDGTRRQWRLWYDSSSGGSIRLDLSDGATAGSTTGLTTPLSNGGFELPALATSPSSGAAPTGWTSAVGGGGGGTGRARGSGTWATAAQLTPANTGRGDGLSDVPPEGQQYAYLARTGSLSQAVVADRRARWSLVLRTAPRGVFMQDNEHGLDLTVDGSVQGARVVSQISSLAWATATRTMALDAGSRTITLQGVQTGTNTGDNSTLIDGATFTRADDVIPGPSVVPPGGVQAGVAYRAVATYDHATRTLRLTVGGTSASVVVGDQGMQDRECVFRLGTSNAALAKMTSGGTLGAVAIGRPTGGVAAAEAAVLAVAAGTAYAGLPGSYAADTGLVSWYDGGSYTDAHGDNDLVTPIRLDGIAVGLNRAHAGRLPFDVDHLGLWSRALSAGELADWRAAANYAAMASGTRAGLVGFWDMDETGGDAVDASGNGNHLILSGCEAADGTVDTSAGYTVREACVFKAVAGAGAGVPWASASSAPFARMTGRRSYDYRLTIDEAGWEWHRHNLTFARDGGTVRFYRNGRSLGSAAVDAATLGPASGTTTVLGPVDRWLSPRAAVYGVAVDDRAPGEASELDENKRTTILVTRTAGLPPLAVHVDATYFEPAGLHRSELAACSILWEFVDRATGQLHTATLEPSGQARARPTGPVAFQHFEAGGSYDCRVSILSPRHDRAGVAQTPALLYSGVAATIVVEPESAWTTTIHIDPVGGNDTTGDGSQASPYQTWAKAYATWTAPRTRILWKRGTEWVHTQPGSQSGAVQVTISGKPGPALIGAYGAGDKPNVRTLSGNKFKQIVLSGLNDFRWVDWDARPAARPSGWTRSNGGFLTAEGGANLLFLRLRQLAGPTDAADRGELGEAKFASATAWVDCESTNDLYCTNPVQCHRLAYDGYVSDGIALGTTSTNDTSYVARLQSNARLVWRGYRDTGSNYFVVSLPAGGTDPAGALTIRYQHDWAVISDCQFKHPLNFSVGEGGIPPGTHRDVTPASGLFLGFTGLVVERCDTLDLPVGGASDLVIRDVHAYRVLAYSSGGNVVVNYTAAGRVRANRPSNVRLLGHRIRLGWAAGSSSLVTPAQPVTPRVLAAGPAMDTGTATAAPTVVATATAPGVALLLASSAGQGPTSAWMRPRWMYRVAGSGAAFAEVAGAAGTALAFRPPTPGTYEFRLDAADLVGGTAAIGGATTTLEVAGEAVAEAARRGLARVSPLWASLIDGGRTTVGLRATPYPLAASAVAATPTLILPDVGSSRAYATIQNVGAADARVGGPGVSFADPASGVLVPARGSAAIPPELSWIVSTAAYAVCAAGQSTTLAGVDFR